MNLIRLPSPYLSIEGLVNVIICDLPLAARINLSSRNIPLCAVLPTIVKHVRVVSDVDMLRDLVLWVDTREDILHDAGVNYDGRVYEEIRREALSKILELGGDL